MLNNTNITHFECLIDGHECTVYTMYTMTTTTKSSIKPNCNHFDRIHA